MKNKETNLRNLQIYIDLDGTLIDISEKYYRIYFDLLNIFNCHKKLTKTQYWNMKKEKYPEEEIIQKTNSLIDIKQYMLLRTELIESTKYLSYDTLLPYTIDTLKKIYNNRIILVTLRTSEEKTKEQLNKFNILYFFDKIIVNDQKINYNSNIKSDMIQQDKSFNKESIVVGDTEADCFAAKNLKVPCLLVSSGIRTKEYLRSLNYGIVIENISELPLIINGEI